MGSGRWDPSTYATNTRSKIASGTNMGYSRAVQSGQVAAAVHDLLDPKKVAGPASPLAGQIVREARDNDEHPNSVPIMLSFDETGSMGSVPLALQKKLAEFFGLVVRKGYVEDPQLSVGAYGDATNGEVAPLQVGQFESDNRADETLDALYLEGNGGGNNGETAALVWYYAAKHTATDAWEKRGKKGYLFTIGDERTHGVTRSMIDHYIGVGHGLEKDLTAKEVAEMAQERWDVYHVVIRNASSQGQRSIEHYTELLGADHVLVLEDVDAVCETIALQIGLAEDTIDLDEGLAHLDEIGSGAHKGEVSKALAHYQGKGGGGAVAVAEAPVDLADDAGGVDRL